MGSNIKIINYFRLTAPEYIPTGMLAFVVGFVFSGGKFNMWLSFLFALISVFFVAAGYNTFNAIYDEGIDAINKPHRPLPRGLINKKEAMNISLVFFFIFYNIC